MKRHLVLRKGAWTREEDDRLRKCIQQFGEGKWNQVPFIAGLNRCRKSCRLRWLNYLRPDIKRGEFSVDEVDLIVRLHKLLGNRWSLISGRLPGRTANDVKNFWNKQIRKKRNNCSDNEEELKAKKVNKTHIFKPRPQRFFSKNSIKNYHDQVKLFPVSEETSSCRIMSPTHQNCYNKLPFSASENHLVSIPFIGLEFSPTNQDGKDPNNSCGAGTIMDANTGGFMNCTDAFIEEEMWHTNDDFSMDFNLWDLSIFSI